jgi:hypothetical protein
MAAKKKAEKPRRIKKQVLVARRPLLFDGLVIKAGQEIPFSNDRVVGWIKDGSAEWVDT